MRSSYKHPLGNGSLPDPLPADQLVKLVERLRSGDVEAIAPIINSHIRLVMGIVANYAKRYPAKVDELVSEGLTALTCDVTKIAKGNVLTDNNISPYLTFRICRAINKFVSQDSIIKIPDSSKRRKKLANPKVSSLNNTIRNERKEGFEDAKEIKFEAALVAKDYDKVCAILEHLESVLHTDLERQIMHLRMLGYASNEIALKLGLRESKVSAIKNEVERRFFQIPFP